MVDYFRQNTYVYILFLRCENAILAILCMVMFISELLESEMSLKILRFLSKNAEICDKLYLKYNISPSKFAGSPNIYMPSASRSCSRLVCRWKFCRETTILRFENLTSNACAFRQVEQICNGTNILPVYSYTIHYRFLKQALYCKVVCFGCMHLGSHTFPYWSLLLSTIIAT